MRWKWFYIACFPLAFYGFAYNVEDHIWILSSEFQYPNFVLVYLSVKRGIQHLSFGASHTRITGVVSTQNVKKY